MADLKDITGTDNLPSGSFNDGTGQVWDSSGQTSGSVDGNDLIRDTSGGVTGWVSGNETFDTHGIKTGDVEDNSSGFSKLLDF